MLPTGRPCRSPISLTAPSRGSQADGSLPRSLIPAVARRTSRLLNTRHLSLSVPHSQQACADRPILGGRSAGPVRLMVMTVPRWPARPSRLGRVGPDAELTVADHYPAPGLADRSVPGRTTACGLRSRLGDGAPDPSPVHRHGSARKRNVGTPGGRDVQLLAIPDATPVTVWAVSRNAAGMLTRTVLPCVPGPRYRS